MGQLPDLVIPLREAAESEELRYALRSAALNLPHGRVWLVGHRPAWASPVVGHIPLVQGPSKYQNSTRAMRAACEHPDVSDPFTWSNDDIYTMHPLAGVPVLHQGPLAEVIRRRRADSHRGHIGEYLRGMNATAARLADAGWPDPLCYELHVPLTVRREPMLVALDLGQDLPVWHKRTAFGAVADLGGEYSRDCKIYARNLRWDPDAPFVSTSDEAWLRSGIGQHVRAAFPEPCEYEQPEPPRPVAAYRARRAPARRA